MGGRKDLQEALFASVDALLAEEPQLPPPAERSRLRQAAGATQARVAKALGVTEQTVKNWENGRSEPRGARLAAYQRLLEGWSKKFPSPQQTPATPTAPVATATPPAAAPQPPSPTPPDTGRAAAAPPTPRPRAQPPTTPTHPQAHDPTPPEASTPTGESHTTAGPTTRGTTRRTTTRRTATPTDARFPHGPLAVLDGDGHAHTVDGTVLPCPATTVPELAEWTLRRSGLGAPRLHRHGKDQDPLVVLTAEAAARFGLPDRLQDRRGLRLPEDHPVVQELERASWRLTRRGFGPWPRLYRPAQGSRRQCVQLAVLPWGALDDRSWPGVTRMPPAEIARALGVYAQRVLTPRGGTAVCGLELMTALRPPTRPVRDPATGGWVPGHNPGSLGTEPMDPAPPEATAEHPVVVHSGWDRGFLDEEAYQWVRPVETLTDAECLLPNVVGLDLNTAFLAAASRLTVGLSEPEHVVSPPFDPKTPGCWLVDLSHVAVDPRLPSPFTPTGAHPTGPAWYATPTVAYAQELGYEVHPLEAFVRRHKGAYLDPWHDRLRSAYVDTLADLGVTRDLTDREFLAAMARHRETDPALAAVLTAIKATVKGGIGKLRERPQGRHYRDGERWPALERPTWRPDIRAAVIAKARVNMHRKLRNMAAMTGRYPLAVLSDCVVYPSPGDSPLDILPYAASGQPQPGAFRLGPSPGLAKLEGVQTMLWAVELMEQGYNPARHIKGGDAVLDEGE